METTLLPSASASPASTASIPGPTSHVLATPPGCGAADPAGISIGITIGTFALFSVLFYLHRRRKLNKAKTDSRVLEAGLAGRSSRLEAVELEGNGKMEAVEMEVPEKIYELPGPVFEMDGVDVRGSFWSGDVGVAYLGGVQKMEGATVRC